MPDQSDHNQLARHQQAEPGAMPDGMRVGYYPPDTRPGTVAAVDAVFREFGIDSWSSRPGQVTAQVDFGLTPERLDALYRALEQVLPVGVTVDLVCP